MREAAGTAAAVGRRLFNVAGDVAAAQLRFDIAIDSGPRRCRGTIIKPEQPPQPGVLDSEGSHLRLRLSQLPLQ